MGLDVGEIVEGKVTGITKFGAFVEIPGGKTGMVHISEIAPVYVSEIREHVSENQVVKVKILNVTEDGKVSLSIKKAMDTPAPRQRRERPASAGVSAPKGPTRPANIEWGSQKKDPTNFEDMLNRFKQNSEDKQSDLKRAMKDSGRRGARRGNGANPNN